MTVFDKNRVEWVGGRYLDPVQRTFRYEGSYYKAIVPEGKQHVDFLISEGVLNELMKDSLIPETSVSKRKLDFFPIVLKQASERFRLPPNMWNPLMIKDAARTYIDINKALLKRNLGLMDGHYGNFVVQNNSRVKWCDIGSIAKMDNENLSGISEFVQYVVYPLLIRSKSSHFDGLMRHFYANGTSRHEALSLLGELVTLPNDRARSLEILDELIENMDFSWTDTLWSDYGSEDIKNISIDEELSGIGNVRGNVIKRVIKTLKPKEAMDLGSNTGYYSILLAQAGAEVLALEQDEAAASKCHSNFKKQPSSLHLKVGRADVGIDIGQKADLVLALALSHHLFFKGQYSFQAIAPTLAQKCSKNLITEFMPNGLGVDKPHIHPLPEDYTLECFVHSLDKYFNKVEIHDYPSYPSRKLILALGRNNIAAKSIPDGFSA